MYYRKQNPYIRIAIEVSQRITSCGDTDNFHQECVLAEEHINVRDISHTWKVSSSTEIVEKKNKRQDERFTRHSSHASIASKIASSPNMPFALGTTDIITAPSRKR